jgi:hypothetical protein
MDEQSRRGRVALVAEYAAAGYPLPPGAAGSRPAASGTTASALRSPGGSGLIDAPTTTVKEPAP